MSEGEIVVAKAELGREGIGSEPASAVTLAGLKKLVADGRVATSESVVLLLTGHTLKDADYTIDFHRGTLLSEAESTPVAAAMEPLRRNALSVEATPQAVLAALHSVANTEIARTRD